MINHQFHLATCINQQNQSVQKTKVAVSGQLPEWTQSRMDTIPKGHNPEWTQSRMDAIPNGHNPERTQSRMSTYNYIVTLVFNSYCLVRSFLRRRGFKQKLILCMNLSDL